MSNVKTTNWAQRGKEAQAAINVPTLPPGFKSVGGGGASLDPIVAFYS